MAHLFRLINKLPLEEFIEKTDLGLEVAPFLDPTLFMKKGKNAELMLTIAKAYQKLKTTINEAFHAAKTE